jgi:uncharacterized protein (DUF1015 family)
MADVQPLRALHYDQSVAGPLQDLAAPPYDVIDDEQRAGLVAQSPHNVVGIDLPRAEDGGDVYEAAAALLAKWREEGAIVRDDEPAIWALTQDYTTPDGRTLTRQGFLARVRVEDYGPGRIRPHERTHPGPKEDRLRLTRATQANLSPIFSLYSDPDNRAWKAIETGLDGDAWGEVTDPDGTVHRVWRVADPDILAEVHEALGDAELLIADGHHRYETARVYAEEIGGEGPHRFVLMCLVALEDPGLTVFPTHRLVRGLRPDQHETLATALKRDFEITEVTREELVPPPGGGPLELGYIDAHFRRPFRLKLRDQSIADEALAGHAAAYRSLDTAVLEAVVLKGALEMTEESIAHFEGIGYGRDDEDAIASVENGDYDVAFLMRPAPVSQIRDVAQAAENMPPKSTYFFPKVLTGLIFNPLGSE